VIDFFTVFKFNKNDNPIDRMRILSLQNLNYIDGGSDSCALTMARFFTQKGHTVIPFTMRHPMNYPSPYEKFFVSYRKRDYHELSSKKKIVSAIQVIYNIESRQKLKCLMAKFSPDLAIIHNIYNNLSTSILWELRAKNIPTVMVVHDYRLICPNHLLFVNKTLCERCIKGNYLWCIIKRCVRKSLSLSSTLVIESFFWRLSRVWTKCIDYFVTPSCFMKNKLASERFPSDRIVHIPNIIETENLLAGLHRTDCRKRYVLYFGRLADPKGLLTLLKAWKSTQNRAGHSLRIVGGGPQEEELKNFVFSEGVKDVLFKGWKSGVELVDEIANCSFAILPSEWYENFGLSTLEAYAASRPILISDRGGAMEMVEDGVTGRIFRAGDVMDLQRKLVLMLRSYPKGLDSMGQKGKELLENKYSPEKIMTKWTMVFQSAIKRKN